MRVSHRFPLNGTALLTLGMAVFFLFPARGNDKDDMPDLCQVDQTCLPTSAANVIVWFGTHGYPKLIVDGDSKDDGFIHTVHAIMTDTNANFDFGTRMDAITYGIKKYIRDAGYSCDVEYRGVDWSQAKFPDAFEDPDSKKYMADAKTPAAFTSDWLQENNDPTKAFLLLVAYCKFDPGSNSFSDVINAGHAVTLVNAQPNMILINDPAHYDDEPGRKILTPTPLVSGVFHLPGYDAPVAGLMTLSGSIMDAPPDGQILLTGAVCVTMHPGANPQDSTAMGTVGSGKMIGVTGTGSTAPTAKPTGPASPSQKSGNRSWAMWLFDLLFTK